MLEIVITVGMRFGSDLGDPKVQFTGIVSQGPMIARNGTLYIVNDKLPGSGTMRSPKMNYFPVGTKDCLLLAARIRLSTVPLAYLLTTPLY